MTFRVWQKVVCVDDGPTDKDGGRVLTLGTIYTIRWLGSWSERGVSCPDGVRLVEVDRGPDEWCPEVLDMPFRASRFRPIVENKTSVSFTTGADPESKNWDNRKKVREKV